jgi:hypothetical protein
MNTILGIDEGITEIITKIKWLIREGTIGETMTSEEIIEKLFLDDIYPKEQAIMIGHCKKGLINDPKFLRYVVECYYSSSLEYLISKD